ncbi:MAG: DUF2723 domain-containing protein [Bacteroidota bacterium]
MTNFKQLNNIVGWSVFAIAAIVYILSAEPTGSLWDCGEFIAGAYKLQVVHPPGAPLFLLIGRMFTLIAELVSNDPATIAYSVNILSGICTAFVVLFVFWTTTMLGKMALVGRGGALETDQGIAVLGAGVVAGLATTFATSIWFSAVEGEVYAMSTFFTALVTWASIKWYTLPEDKYVDRWLVFAMYMVGLSMGVHLLSLLVIPMIAMLYYLKKTENVTLKGIAISLVAGALIFLIGIQYLIIKVLPKIGQNFDYIFVNSLGLPFNSGLLFFVLICVALFGFGLYYTHKHRNGLAQRVLVCFFMVFLGFSTYGVIVLRANANTPINMNNPSDAFSLISYLNREQYGSRDLMKGPHFDSEPIDIKSKDKYGRVGDRYEVIDRKLSYVYPPGEEMMLPRMGDYQGSRPAQYKRWMGLDPNKPLPQGRPNQADNIRFMMQYQLGWMYWRYFMWNFAGRQNGRQGYFSWDLKDGHWISGIKPLDNARLYKQNYLPESEKDHKGRNTYFMLPFLFGLIGLFFHFKQRPNEAMALMVLFLMTGVAIIMYSNQPPNEPRERDYVLAGSMFTYCIWIGMAVLALFEVLKTRLGGSADFPGKTNAAKAFGATAVVMIAPLIMGFQNWDDHSRGKHTGARDYAVNFLESCAPNSIVFTHGDNDTYPLWYAQEVENIRTDVRVVNLSLLAVDWYIDQLRRKVNDSPPLKMTMDPLDYRGDKRNSMLYYRADGDKPLSIHQLVKWMSDEHEVTGPSGETYASFVPTRNVYIPVDKAKIMENGTILEADTGQVLDLINFTFEDVHRGENNQIRMRNLNAQRNGEQPQELKTKRRFIKDDIAMLDIISSNIWERPIYWAVTCRPEKMLGLQDYTRLEGLALRLVPKRCAGDGSFGEMPIGRGCINTDLMYDNVMNKFRWGNFDKYELFVDHSYLPSVSSLRFSMLRLAQTLREEGDKERAVNVINKYFESFPHKNFPYDYNALYMIREYDAMGAFEDGKEHIRILARETADWLEFYESLNEKVLKSSFRSDFERTAATMNELVRIVENPGFADIRDEVTNHFKAYIEVKDGLKD